MATPTAAPKRTPANPAFWEIAPLVGALVGVLVLVDEVLAAVVEVVVAVVTREVPPVVVVAEPARGAVDCPAIWARAAAVKVPVMASTLRNESEKGVLVGVREF